MIRIVIDTNVFVAAAYNPRSSSRKIVNAVWEKQLRLVVSPAIIREYKMVLPKAIRSDDAREEVWKAIKCAQSVTPQENPSVTEDRSDDKFLAAAVAGEADAVITNDEHLLAVHPYQVIEILQPSEFRKRLHKGRL